MIPDVELQRAARLARRIRRAIGLDLVGLALDQLRRLLEVGLRPGELPDGDVAMAAMAIELRVVGMQLDAFREHRNRIVEAPQIAKAAAHPDDRLGILRVCRKGLLRLREIGVELLLVRNRLPGRYSGLPESDVASGFACCAITGCTDSAKPTTANRKPQAPSSRTRTIRFMTGLLRWPWSLRCRRRAIPAAPAGRPFAPPSPGARRAGSPSRCRRQARGSGAP